MTTPGNPLFASLPRSHVFRILVLGLLVLVLQIPIFMIEGLIGERQLRRDQAVEEVASKWGRQQVITGPALVVPYIHRWTEESAAGRSVAKRETRFATFLPERLAVRGRLEAEARRRGIFSIPVYRAALQVEGAFVRPRFAAWNVDEADVNWGRAQLVIGVSDTRALRAPTSVQWDGGRAEMLPGSGEFGGSSSGVHAEVMIPPGSREIGFSFPLESHGSAGAYWTPFGKTTQIVLGSNWASPSFQGNWLPLRHSVSSRGFDAEWDVPYLGRNFPQAWRGTDVSRETIEASRFGVDLIETVDHYRMAQRSVKYAALFVLLTFAAVWLVEVLGAIQVHPIQYLLLGGALCVFYLLELSLSEHLGFGRAYLLATVAVVGEVAGYSLAVLRSRRRALVVAGTVAALYGYLYVLLTNEDYALLIGSLGVFLILAAIMYVTRRVDWYAPGSAPQVSGTRD